MAQAPVRSRDYSSRGKTSARLIVVWGWEGVAGTASEVSLFPLVPWAHIRERVLPQAHATMAGRRMVDYHDLAKLRHFTLYVRSAATST